MKSMMPIVILGAAVLSLSAQTPRQAPRLAPLRRAPRDTGTSRTGTRLPRFRRPAGSGARPTRTLIMPAPDPPTSNGHKLDLYIPAGATRPLPVAIWTSGSAWLADNGKNGAGILAAQLNPEGYAVAGVSIRSSSQVQFPGQLYDIKAAIRWLRANAVMYGLDAKHFAILGDSSGGWTTAMAAVTGDAPETGRRRIHRHPEQCAGGGGLLPSD